MPAGVGYGKRLLDMVMDMDMSGNAGRIATVGAMAAVGGTTSYMTGGTFTQGALAGGLFGAGVVKGGQFMSNLPDATIKEHIGESMVSLTAGMRQMGKPFFEDTFSRRASMVGGAALGGFIFGGRRNHGRGFNSRRGNRI